MDLLESHHAGGLRFEPVEVIEKGDRVAAQLHHGLFQVFTFEGERLVLMQDCLDREDALAQLAAA